MTGLSLARIAIDPVALAEFGVAESVSDDCNGYALHLALRWRYGQAAPQPFCLRMSDPRQVHILGYLISPEKLSEAHSLPGTNDLLERVFPEAPVVRAMPQTWALGARYRFEVRVRPVVRYGNRVRQIRAAQQRAWQRNAREIDAFVAACERANGQRVDREDVYREWLRARLANKAEIEHAHLASTERVRSRRSSHGHSAPGLVEGVEAIIRGTLKVTDGAAFADCLKRGIGRHAAFGNGMLLLSPAS